MKNRTFIGIFCIILAVTVMFGISPIINKASSGEVVVVQAKSLIPEGKVITSDDIVNVKIGKLGVKDGFITDTKLVIGKAAKTDLYAGVNIYPEMVGLKKDTASDIINSLNGKELAMSISVKSFSDGLSGKLQNGDIVSLVVTESSNVFIPPELTYVKVITTTSSKGVDLEDQAPKEDGSIELPASVTLLVNQTQAKLLAKYDENAKIRLALVYRGSEETAQSFLDVQNKVFTSEVK